MYIEGYNDAEAKEFIHKGLIQTGKYRDIPSDQLMRVIEEAMAQDEAYMKKVGIIAADDGEVLGDGYYDDDDAFEFIVDELVDNGRIPELPEMKIAEIVDDYMELNQEYLEQKGLISWDDE